MQQKDQKDSIIYIKGGRKKRRSQTCVSTTGRDCNFGQSPDKKNWYFVVLYAQESP